MSVKDMGRLPSGKLLINIQERQYEESNENNNLTNGQKPQVSNGTI